MEKGGGSMGEGARMGWRRIMINNHVQFVLGRRANSGLT